ARAAAADERRQRLQRVAFFMFLAVFFDHRTDHLFRSKGGLVRRGERRVFRQPHIHVREVRQILREEGLFELPHEKPAERQKDERTGKDLPTVVNGRGAYTVIKSRKAFLSPLLNAGFRLLPQQVLTEHLTASHPTPHFT